MFPEELAAPVEPLGLSDVLAEFDELDGTLGEPVWLVLSLPGAFGLPCGLPSVCGEVLPESLGEIGDF